MRFILFVEGHTEQEAMGGFLKRWLDPRLSQPVGMRLVRFGGCHDFLKGIATRVHMHLEGPGSAEIIAALGLLDLYGPATYPAHLSSAEERYTWAATEMERNVNHPRFRMFFAVHEVEAWILSQPQLLPEAVRRALPGRASQPESIDFDEPPSKVLQRLYQTHTHRSYKKRTYGADLFRKLDPALAYEKCPHLAIMLDHMLKMAHEAGC